MIRRFVALVALIALPAIGGAQAGRAGGAGRAGAAAQVPPRAAQEARVGQRAMEQVRNVLRLNAAQTNRLRDVRQRYDRPLTQLLQRERMVRQAIRQATTSGASDGADALIKEFYQIQHEKVTLAEQEQEEVKAFLTPLQRMQYLALQDRVSQVLDNAVPPLPAGGRAGGVAAPPE